jgi:DNA repair protein RecO (recombination protein O)
MEWVDDAIVLGARHFGEGKLVAEVFARAHGRFGGVVHAGRKSQPILQAGNLVHTGWKARLSEQLGFFYPLELVEPHATRLLDDPIALAGLSSAVALVRGAAEKIDIRLVGRDLRRRLGGHG